MATYLLLHLALDLFEVVINRVLSSTENSDWVVFIWLQHFCYSKKVEVNMFNKRKQLAKQFVLLLVIHITVNSIDKFDKK